MMPLFMFLCLLDSCDKSMWLLLENVIDVFHDYYKILVARNEAILYRWKTMWLCRGNFDLCRNQLIGSGVLSQTNQLNEVFVCGKVENVWDQSIGT